MLKRLVIIILFFALLPCALSAQVLLRGVVSDKLGTLPGVNVFIVNENERILTGVITDANGAYFLNVPTVNQGSIKIMYSFVGYTSKTVEYKEQKELNITLEENMTILESVTVLGKAVERNDMGIPYKDLGSSTERINMAEMEDMAVTSVEDMLQGRLANVDLISSSGSPGAGKSIRIRGTSSLTASSEPLIVVDGFPLTVDIDGFDFSSADVEDFGSLVSISPDDIESIEVLKDAASTAVWGSQGGNGVLLITTKRGSTGKTTITITEKVNINFEPKAIEMLDGFQYVSLMQEEIWNHGMEHGFFYASNMAKLKDPQITFNPDYEYWREFNQNTNWLEEITRNALLSETTFGMSGGGERAKYRFSIGYLTELGTTIGTDYDRLNARLNLDYRFSTKLSIRTGLVYSFNNRNSPYQASMRGHAMNKMPNMSPYYMDENNERTDIYFTPQSTIQGSWAGVFNPISMAHEAKNNTLKQVLRMDISLYYELIKGLNYIGEVALEVSDSDNEKYLPQLVSGVLKTHDSYNLRSIFAIETTNVYINNKMTYTKSFEGGHKIAGTALLRLSDQMSSGSSFTQSGYASSDNLNPELGGAIRTLGASYNQSKSMNATLSMHYNYKDKYLVMANNTWEGNSRMSQDNRWSIFPSASFAWRFNRENLLKEMDWLSDSKLRVSWGLNGNSPDGSAPYVGTFKAVQDYGDISSVEPNKMQLNALEWEIVEQLNFGLDLALMNNKVMITFDYYDKESSNLLQRNVKIPTSTGFEKVAYLNSGVMSNKGWEFRIDYRDLVKKGDFKLSVNANISSNKNVVEEIPDYISAHNYPDVLENKTYATAVVPDRAMGSFFGFDYLGVYSDKESTIMKDAAGNNVYDITGAAAIMRHEERIVQPGDAIYRDVNKDGAITRDDIVYLGNGMPKFTGGFGINMSYRGFSLNTFFHLRYDYDVINQQRMNSENMHGFNNQQATVLDRWRHEGDVTNIPRAIWTTGYNWLGSSRFVEDASFLRLKELTLRYTLPKGITNRLSLNRLSVYVSGYDLFTWTNYSGQEPEVSIKGGIDGGMGYDSGLTPKPRRIAIGVNIDF